ncbi:MAG: MBL fold metallo-hydrolase [Candidatus Omnitrophota bacterium]
MQLIVHRGTKEIGGSCVELISKNSRILIDFGMPLVNSSQEPFDSKALYGKSIDELKTLKILPDIKGLYEGEKQKIEAILLSHSHLDHYGFMRYINKDIPVYLSRGAQELIQVSNIFTPNSIGSFNAQIIGHLKTFQIGNFTITPYLVDHSAFDAYAFLIESEGKRLFYSGDFRAHGRKNILFKRMLKNPPKDIDCLLMEGTMMGRGNQLYENETAVENKIKDVLEEHKNITFLFASSQNIDRIVSAYRACLKTDSIFVINLYTAFILDKLKAVSTGIPQFDWKNIRVYFLHAHANKIAEFVSVKLLYKYNQQRIKFPEINQKKNNILMLTGKNSFFPIILKNINNFKGAKIIYSMWEGYLDDKFRQYCKEQGLTIEQIHTSGHATVEDLKVFAKALNPKTLIPIHTFESKKYPAIFKNVKVLKDGEEFKI